MSNRYLLAALVLSLFGVQIYQQQNSTIIQEVENQRPIIGIFTQPSEWKEYDKSNYTYIAASYVKFIEQSGARVVPIPYEASNETLETIFQSINGFLVPGGSTLLKGSKFTQSIAYMLNRAIQANDAGDFFPVMAVCLGHEALHYILSDYDPTALFAVSGESGIVHPIQNAKRSSIFYKDMSYELFTEFTTQGLSYFHHSWGIQPELYVKHQKLNDMMEITGVNTDDQGYVFISSTQGKKYPIYTTQYHSEKNSYEWEISANHSQSAVDATNAHSRAFVSQARKSHHNYSSSNDETNSLIYNSPVVHIKGSGFSEIYFVKRLN